MKTNKECKIIIYRDKKILKIIKNNTIEIEYKDESEMYNAILANTKGYNDLSEIDIIYK